MEYETIRELIARLEQFLIDNELDDIEYICGGAYGATGEIHEMTIRPKHEHGKVIAMLHTDIFTG